MLGGASALALSATAAGRTAPKAEAPSVSEVVVTGSRIVRNGNEAPTPVTVASTEQLVKAQPESIVQALVQLPQFQGVGSRSTDTNTGGNVSGNHGGFLNLRRLGVNRTLVLLDGRRLPPSTPRGEVDASLLPEMLVQRVEVVTGGASAVYGSDAVAGVVNYVLDDKFKGLRLDAQGGVSTYNDTGNYKIGGAFGKDLLDGRAHVMGSVEYFDGQGITRRDRPGYFDGGYFFVAKDPTKPGGTAANPWVIRGGVSQSNPVNSSGAFRSGPPGVINTTFSSTGQIIPFDFGQPTGVSGQIIGGGGTISNSAGYSSLVSPQRTLQSFGRITYDVTDDLKASLDVMYGHVHTDVNEGSVNLSNQLVFSGNPFLPAQIQSILTATNTASVRYSRQILEGAPRGNPGYEDGSSLTLTASLKGKVFGKYNFDLYYSHGRAREHTFYSSQQNQHLYAALDAVRNPATGQIVCNVDLIKPAWYTGGCVPLNVFGPTGTVTPEMVAYIVGHPEARVKNDQDNVGFNIQGDLFSTWAGPISASVGAEWRKTTLDQTSNSDPNVLPDFTGIRFGGTSRDMLKFFIGSITPAKGSVSVTEGFGEAVVPLAKDLPLAKKLELSLAGRVTHYTTSGTVGTWKVGVSDELVEGLRFRATVSRDIRAPNIFELFSGTVLAPSPSIDPHCNCQSGNFATVLSGGNPNLKPEKADTKSFGVVWQPPFVPRFSISVDRYDIRITGAIASQTADALLQDCEASNGTGPSCALITRPLPFSNRTVANYPTQILTLLQNLSFMATRGVDIEGSYNFDLDTINDKLSGNLGARLLANYVDTYRTQLNSISPVLENAGVNPIPHWRGNLAVTYQNGPFSLYVQGRYIGRMLNGTNLTAGQVFDPAHIPSVTYVDTTLSYKTAILGRDTEAFLTINNFFNKKAPLVPLNTGTISTVFPTIVELYDVIGRYFTLGVRVRM